MSMASRRSSGTSKAARKPAAQTPAQAANPPVPEDADVGWEEISGEQPNPARRRIRLITGPPVGEPQTTMGRAIRPFAKPAQSGTFAPFAVAQARRGR
jgi:hypothetical protein